MAPDGRRPPPARAAVRGPHAAYWADAKIGSHVGISKEPDIYERGLFNVLGSFHTDGAVTPRSPGEKAASTSD
ncbi:hypothetical protein ACFQRB_19840 [Halobaculum litoreum]|uniref:Uncharacterized protein n=1 Tax=Halobaculum litoreum TaxID=3031998 RepID=A0ABD5XXK3_9EURY